MMKNKNAAFREALDKIKESKEISDKFANIKERIAIKGQRESLLKKYTRRNNMGAKIITPQLIAKKLKESTDKLRKEGKEVTVDNLNSSFLNELKKKLKEDIKG